MSSPMETPPATPQADPYCLLRTAAQLSTQPTWASQKVITNSLLDLLSSSVSIAPIQLQLIIARPILSFGALQTWMSKTDLHNLTSSVTKAELCAAVGAVCRLLESAEPAARLAAARILCLVATRAAPGTASSASSAQLAERTAPFSITEDAGVCHAAAQLAGAMLSDGDARVQLAVLRELAMLGAPLLSDASFAVSDLSTCRASGVWAVAVVRAPNLHFLTLAAAESCADAVRAQLRQAGQRTWGEIVHCVWLSAWRAQHAQACAPAPRLPAHAHALGLMVRALHVLAWNWSPSLATDEPAFVAWVASQRVALCTLLVGALWQAAAPVVPLVDAVPAQHHAEFQACTTAMRRALLHAGAIAATALQRTRRFAAGAHSALQSIADTLHGAQLAASTASIAEGWPVVAHARAWAAVVTSPEAANLAGALTALQAASWNLQELHHSVVCWASFTLPCSAGVVPAEPGTAAYLLCVPELPSRATIACWLVEHAQHGQACSISCSTALGLTQQPPDAPADGSAAVPAFAKLRLDDAELAAKLGDRVLVQGTSNSHDTPAHGDFVFRLELCDAPATMQGWWQAARITETGLAPANWLLAVDSLASGSQAWFDITLSDWRPCE